MFSFHPSVRHTHSCTLDMKDSDPNVTVTDNEAGALDEPLAKDMVD